MKMSTFGILDWTSYIKALQAIEEILSRVFKWRRFRNVVERWFFYIKHRIKRFYENLCQGLDHLDTQK
jgi:hypothetical protein